MRAAQTETQKKGFCSGRRAEEREDGVLLALRRVQEEGLPVLAQHLTDAVARLLGVQHSVGHGGRAACAVDGGVDE